MICRRVLDYHWMVGGNGSSSCLRRTCVSVNWALWKNNGPAGYGVWHKKSHLTNGIQRMVVRNSTSRDFLTVGFVEMIPRPIDRCFSAETCITFPTAWMFRVMNEAIRKDRLLVCLQFHSLVSVKFPWSWLTYGFGFRFLGSIGVFTFWVWKEGSQPLGYGCALHRMLFRFHWKHPWNSVSRLFDSRGDNNWGTFLYSFGFAHCRTGHPFPFWFWGHMLVSCRAS